MQAGLCLPSHSRPGVEFSDAFELLLDALPTHLVVVLDAAPLRAVAIRTVGNSAALVPHFVLAFGREPSVDTDLARVATTMGTDCVDSVAAFDRTNSNDPSLTIRGQATMSGELCVMFFAVRFRVMPFQT